MELPIQTVVIMTIIVIMGIILAVFIMTTTNKEIPLLKGFAEYMKDFIGGWSP